MNPAEQGQNGTTSGNIGAGGGTPGMEPTTPAVGASSSTADPMASGIGIDDMATRSGPDVSESSVVGASGGSEKLARVKEEAVKLRGQATDRARNAAEQGKTRATETIDGFARAVHEAAGNLEQQVNPQVAQYAHRAADALDSLSDSLRNKSVDELIDDARDFARRSPAVAIGAAVAVGFALSRFLKATSSPRAGSYQRNAYALDEDEDDEMPSLTTTRTGGGTEPRYNA